MLAASLAAGTMLLSGQSLNDLTPQLPVSDPLCSFFGAQQAQFVNANTMPFPENGQAGLAHMTRIGAASMHAMSLSSLTSQVAGQLPPAPGGTRTGSATADGQLGMIDQYLFAAMSDAGVEPAVNTTDWEFYRRASLDLTGRIPTPAALLAFVNDTTTANKRAAAVDAMIAAPEWVDKWTMYFGDLLKNNSSNAQIDRYRPGVAAFYAYIKSSIASDKPYDQMTRELITAVGDNSYTTGEINFNVGGVVTGGPQQDILDQQTANIADTFLGIAHMNCLLCHNGAGHLTGLSLWGGQQTRVAAWGMSAFLAHTYTFSTAVSSAAVTPRYWTVTDSSTKANTNYLLNTTTGNRPPRQPIGTVSSIAPTYIFTGATPMPGENYRTAMARMITADPQFARATVNYLWAYFLRSGSGRSAGSVRSAAARSGQSSPGAVDSAGIESAAAERSGAGFYRQ